MGEIADDMTDGTCCQLCGCYFLDKDDRESLYVHEYPVVCWNCWKDLTKAERKQYQRAEVPTL